MSLPLPRLYIRRMRLITPYPRPKRPLLDDMLRDHVPDHEERAGRDHPCFQGVRAEDGVV
jgi:hypothetical protein